MEFPTTPPYSDPGISEVSAMANSHEDIPISPTASSPANATSAARLPTFSIPTNLTQAAVEASAQLKRLQQDLLVLTSFPDNSSLHWRPSWFSSPTYPSAVWTLHNPPHVVTEEMPKEDSVYVKQMLWRSDVMMRRMRKEGDAEPRWMKTKEEWERYCDMYGVPYDFLSENQVRLLRLGLPRSEDGEVCAPPSRPLYPQPAGPALGKYILLSNTNLPRKFRNVGSQSYETDECIVVAHNGAVQVEELADDDIPRCGADKVRWSWVPWTEEQEVSCRPMTVKMKLWNSAMVTSVADNAVVTDD